MRRTRYLSRFLLLVFLMGARGFSTDHIAQLEHSMNGPSTLERLLTDRDLSNSISPRQELRHDAAAIVKLVPVRVVNPDGRPVRTLKKEDFLIYDNSQRQTITEFEIHEPAGLSIPSESGARAAGIQQEVNRKYFFVLDMQGSDRIGNKRAKAAVIGFSSAHLQPGDEICFLTFGIYTGLVLRQYLTADMDKITKAVDHSIEMASIAGAPQADVIEVPDYTADDQSGGLAEGSQRKSGGQTEIFSRPQPEEYQSSNRIVVPGMSMLGGRTYADFDMSMFELATALAYIPGSKIVVYFSTRVPNQSVSHLFADANTTIFAVNTNSVPAKGGGADAGIRRRQKEEQGRVLAAFAEASGGRYFDDAAATDTIAREVREIAGYYYVLGYYIHPSWDGRTHEIRVEVAIPGLRVLAQSGYNDPKPFAQWTDIEKQLHFFDLALSDGPVKAEALDLPLKVLCRSAENEPNLAILTKLQVDAREALPPGRTEAYVLIFDRDRQIVETWRGALSTAAAKTNMFYPYVVTRLPPGPYECRVVFREMETGRSAASRQAFRIPEKLAARRGPLICAPPLLLERTGGAFVRLGKGEKQDRRGDSLLSFYPFWPRDCFPLLGEGNRSEISVLLPVLPSSGFNPEKDIAVELINGDEEKPIAFEWRLIDSRMAKNGAIFCLLKIVMNRQDRFRIRFTVSDALSKARDSLIVSQ